MKKFALLIGALVAAASSQAVTWTILQFPTGSYGAGSTVTSSTLSGVVNMTSTNTPYVGSNAITIMMPNANLLGAGGPHSIVFEYVANNFGGNAVAVDWSISGSVFGTGIVQFVEQVYEQTNTGEFLVGSLTKQWTTSNTPGNTFAEAGLINLSRPVGQIRVKKEIILAAGTGGTSFDAAAVSIMNQSVHVVPEPGTMTALGLGVAALLRRRRKS
ncbi:MAG: PEP-CTERM sorting domain-containing protein [Armatimonadetes bacterium]|nr:PEP-CTERM sorting domain-containing protein [Armatimonadota bacterium]